MFTGLIEEIGYVKQLNFNGSKFKLSINAKTVLKEVSLGDSIAINGVCLTVTEFSHNSFTVDVMPETQQSTNIKQLKMGDPVNLERALAANSRLGGHFVTGHVDTKGHIRSLKTNANAIVVEVTMDPYFNRYLVPKGAITVDGISLTVFNVADTYFSLSLIPHSSKNTTLTNKKVGDFVNLEFDILAKYTEKLLFNATSRIDDTQHQQSQGITLDTLKQYGFN